MVSSARRMSPLVVYCPSTVQPSGIVASAARSSSKLQPGSSPTTLEAPASVTTEKFVTVE